MGVASRSSHVLKVAALAALLVGALVAVRSCGRKSVVQLQPSRPLPGEVAVTELGAEGDTEAETLRTLIGEVKALHEQYAALEGDNKALREQNVRLQRMEDRLSGHLDDQLRGAQGDIERQAQQVEKQQRDAESLLQRLESRVAELNVPAATSPAAPGSDIPVGLGLESYAAERPVTWVDPLDAPPPDASGKRVFPERIRHLVSHVGGEPADGEAQKAARVPVYTVPRNATLIGAHGFTALVGRIPVRGQVVDPFPFKVLVGADNLAANGVVMPELFGMVFSGRAVGDWTLSCVRGEVYSVTYVFQDGSIQSYPEGDAESDDGKPIGWISDAFGVPCVTGERKTNATAFLSERIGLAAASAAAKAAAAADTATTVAGSTGAVTTAVTGDVASFVRNRTVSEGVDEISRWLEERQAQSFDVIYVPPDSELAVHVTRELDLDRDPKGRKVNHRVELQTPSKRPLD